MAGPTDVTSEWPISSTAAASPSAACAARCTCACGGGAPERRERAGVWLVPLLHRPQGMKGLRFSVSVRQAGMRITSFPVLRIRILGGGAYMVSGRAGSNKGLSR